MRGKSGTKYIVDHPAMGRILIRAMGSVDAAKRMIGYPMDGGTCVGVTLNGRPVPDNEPIPYRANKPVATRRIDALHTCVKRLESVSVPLVQPSIPKPRYNGFQRCDGASVDKGAVYDAPPVNTYYTAAPVFPQQSSATPLPSLADALIGRELYRDHAWLRMNEWPRFTEPPKVWHGDVAQIEVFEDCMDNMSGIPLYTQQGKCRDKPLTDGYIDPRMYTPVRVVHEEVDILTRVRQILGKV